MAYTVAIVDKYNEGPKRVLKGFTFFQLRLMLQHKT
jgi:hypothetical protein